ncbi:MAG: four helix bundle protein [Bacteroidales bacterium]|nr:four helix bundle protein [Bacteroidales bacterium]MCF8458414.1 four helix bundle protein [Bacteroidales bacterium]
MDQPEYKRVVLEDRLIDFGLNIDKITNHYPNTRLGNHIVGQMIRSSTSPSFNYGEAQSAESRRDFIHKMKICLKELRETLIGLKYAERGKFDVPQDLLFLLLKEVNELISIFVKSIDTATKNLMAGKK